LKKIMIHLRVWWASKAFTLKIVRRMDVFGKTYRYTYRKYGHKEMVDEYLDTNSWRI